MKESRTRSACSLKSWVPKCPTLFLLTSRWWIWVSWPCWCKAGWKSTESLSRELLCNDSSRLLKMVRSTHWVESTHLCRKEDNNCLSPDFPENKAWIKHPHFIWEAWTQDTESEVREEMMGSSGGAVLPCWLLLCTESQRHWESLSKAENEEGFICHISSYFLLPFG